MMTSGRQLCIDQRKKLDQLIADNDSVRDMAGLQALGLECCTYGILCPKYDDLLAALQLQSHIQVRSCISDADQLASSIAP